MKKIIKSHIKLLINEILKTRKSKLNVFDFDGTLFNSPPPTFDWKKSIGTWYYEPISLSPKLIGDGSGFWNNNVVSAARESLQDEKSITILLTGRIERNFNEIIKELISGTGLNFDLIKLNPGGKTDKFKIEQIKNILQNNNRILG